MTKRNEHGEPTLTFAVKRNGKQISNHRTREAAQKRYDAECARLVKRSPNALAYLVFSIVEVEE